MIFYFLLFQTLLFFVKTQETIISSSGFSSCLSGCCSFADCFAKALNSSLQNLTIYLDGDNFFLFDSDYKSSTPMKIPENINRILLPLSCKTDPNCSQRTTILLKTESFYFDIRGSLTFKNIRILANDLPVSIIMSSNPCLKTIAGCCPNETSYLNVNDSCYLKGKIIARPDRTTLNPMFAMNNNSLGISSNLTLDNCEIRNLYAIKTVGYYTMIQIDCFPANIQIQNSTFANFYFLEGLITATFARAKKAGKTGLFLFYFNSSNVQYYNQYDINEILNPFYGNSIQIAYIMAMQYSQNVTFANSQFYFLGYKLAYFDTCLVFYNNTNFQNFTFKFASNDLITLYSSSLSLKQANFSQINITSRLISAVFSNSITIVNSSVVNCSFRNVGMLYFSQSNFFYMNFTTFKDIAFINSSLFLTAYIQNIMIFWNNQYLNLTNPIFSLDTSNSLKSTFEYFSGLAMISINSSIFTFNKNNTLSFRNSFFYNLTLQTIGSPFNLSLYNTITFQNISMISCMVLLKAGFILLSNNNIVNITFSSFLSITSMLSTVLFSTDSNTIFVSNSDFSEMISNTNGGLFAGNCFNNLQMTNCSSHEITANIQGGLLYFSNNNTISLISSLFLEIASISFGGVIYLSNFNNLTINDSVFKECSVYNYSNGAVLYLVMGNNLWVSYSSFSKGSAQLGGVGVFNENNYIQIYKSEFSLNTASQGSCFYLITSNILILNESMFFNCSSTDLGGVIMASISNNLSIQGTNFIKSHSEIGGVIYLNSLNFLDFHDSLVNMSYSSDRGGCFYLNDENIIYINRSIIENTESFEESGCIYGYVLNALFIKDVTFRNIYAKLRGGAIFLYFNNNVTLFRVNFIDTYAELRGGCVYISNANMVEAEFIEIEDNSMPSDFQFMIFFLNNNYFTFRNLTFLQIGLGIFISNFNEGNFTNIAIIENKTAKEIATFNTGSYHQNQEIVIESIDEDRIFIIIYSSTMILENLEFSNLTYPLLSALQRDITLTNIINKFNVLDNGSTLFSVEMSTFHGYNMIFLHNLANIFYFNASDATFNNISIVYEDGSFQIIDFLNGIAQIIKGTLKFDISLTKIAISEFSDNSVTNFYFEASDVKIIRMTFINNFGEEGGVLKFLNSNATILKCSFFMNGASSNGGAISFDIENDDNESDGQINQMNTYIFSLENSYFLKNLANNFGGALVFYKFPSPSLIMKIYMKKNTFMGNQGNVGGVLYINVFDGFELKNGNFYQNRAILKKFQGGVLSIYEGIGGVMFISNNPYGNSSNSFSNLKFINNSADIGGAVFFEAQILNFAENDTFIRNKARNYGPNVASVAARISFSSIYEKHLGRMYLNNLQSGSIYHCPYSIISYDKYDQLVRTKTTDYNYVEDFSYDSLVRQLGITLTNNINDHIIFSNDINGYCPSKYLVPSPLYSSQMFFKINFTTVYNEIYPPLRLFLNFRACQIGEYLKDQKCFTCPINYYLLIFNENVTECNKCVDSDPFYCYGGSNLTPKPNYWRYDYYSDNFMLCPNPASCLGYSFQNASLYNPLMAMGECAYGYEGILCGECIDNFGTTDRFFCSKCDNDYIYFTFILSMIAKVVIILFSVHKAMIMCLSLITSNIVNLRKVISSILMKILFNHLQCLIIVFSIPSLIMPDAIKQMLTFSKATSPNVTEVMSLECVMKNLKMVMNPQSIKLLIIWISPVILILISSGYLAIYLKNKKKKYVIENIMDRLRIWFAIFMTVLMILYPDCMRICFETFNCLNVGYGVLPQYRLAADYSIKCWQGLHWHLIYGAATPFLIIFGIGFPMFVLFKLLSHWKTNSLNNKMELLKYGYFYFGYDKQFFFWDMVILARKIAILLIDVFFLTSYNSQLITQPVLAIFLVLFIALYIQLVFQPYRKDKLDLINSLENKSLIALVGTVYVGLLNIEVVFGEKSISGVVLFILIFLINLNFAVFWCLACFKYIVSATLKKWKIALMSCFISSYGVFKRHFQKSDPNRAGVSKERWAMLDKYTIELKKKTRKARQNPMQESLIEQIRKSSLKDLKNKKRKTTICIKQPDRFKCANCEMTLKIEEENKKLRDELFSMREKIDNKDAYLKELQTKLSQMKTMMRTGNKNADLDLKVLKTLKSEKIGSPIQKTLSLEIEKSDSEILGDKLKNHFNMVKCLHQKEKLLTKEKYEISTTIFLYTSKDIKKEFYLNVVLYYDFEVELNDMLINYDYDQEKIRSLFY